MKERKALVEPDNREGLSINRHWFRHYNQERFHQGLDYKTPDEVYGFAEAA